MPERRGFRPIDQIEKEWPTEAPIRSDVTDDVQSPTDTPDEVTSSNVRDDLEIADSEPLPRLEPMWPGDKEAERWNREADEIEKWAQEEGDQAEYLRDVTRRMYEPTDATDGITSTEVTEDLPSANDDMPFESDTSASDTARDAASDDANDVDSEP